LIEKERLITDRDRRRQKIRKLLLDRSSAINFQKMRGKRRERRERKRERDSD
jgi:hypothetical protein